MDEFMERYPRLGPVLLALVLGPVLYVLLWLTLAMFG
jgi:hypothetical protein